MTTLEKFIAQKDQRRIYLQERLNVEVTELMCKMLKRHGVSRRELAKRLNRTGKRVDATLAGELNLTLRQVADVFTALGLELKITAVPIQPGCLTSKS